jgi:hypothetical protein
LIVQLIFDNDDWYNIFYKEYFNFIYI